MRKKKKKMFPASPAPHGNHVGGVLLGRASMGMGRNALHSAGASTCRRKKGCQQGYPEPRGQRNAAGGAGGPPPAPPGGSAPGVSSPFDRESWKAEGRRREMLPVQHLLVGCRGGAAHRSPLPPVGCHLQAGRCGHILQRIFSPTEEFPGAEGELCAAFCSPPTTAGRVKPFSRPALGLRADAGGQTLQGRKNPFPGTPKTS